MNDLIVKYNGALVTTQNKISKLTNNNEISIQKLIRTYKVDLEEFGILEFENQLIINSKNVKNYKKIYYLNEQQATLLLTYMKNSESVRNAKKVLVFAFYQMKEKLRSLEQEQEKARFKSLSDENLRLNSLNHHQKIGYKSQLAQQKEHYENKIKALKYDLEKKKELSFKRKLSKEELLELRKILAKDYNMLCFKEWEYMLFAESVSGKNYKLEKENDFCIYKSIKDSFNSKLDYYKNYEEYEEKWRKILRR
ncbi:phage regulatory protein [Campylobacter coli]|nr:phage regulatory protein [Campylobacter coli]